MAPPPHHTGAEERTERRHRQHDSHRRPHRSERHRSPAAGPASPTVHTDTKSRQALRGRSLTPPSHRHRRHSPVSRRGGSPSLSIREQPEKRDARLARRDDPSPPPRRIHRQHSRSPSPHRRNARRERSRSAERSAYHHTSLRGRKGEYRIEDESHAGHRRHRSRSPRRSPSLDSRARPRRKSRSPVSFRRSRSPASSKINRDLRKESKYDWDIKSRDRRERAEEPSGAYRARREKYHRRSPSPEISQRRRSKTPPRRRRSITPRRESGSERAFAARRDPHRRYSRSPRRRESPKRRSPEPERRDTQKRRSRRSRSRSRETVRSSRRLTPERPGSGDTEMYPPPHRGGYYGPPPPHARAYGPPPIDTRFSQSPPHPMQQSPHHHPSPHGFSRGGYGPGYSQVTRISYHNASRANHFLRPPQGWSPQHTPPSYSPYDNRGYGPPQGGPPQQGYYGPPPGPPYSNQSSPGPSGPPPRNYQTAPNHYGPPPSPHGSPPHGAPPSFPHHPHTSYSQRGARGGGPRGGYPPRAGYPPPATQAYPQPPPQTSPSPSQPRSGPHFANLTWKPGVGTRGGHAPKSLFQASQGQTSGPNGPVNDKPGKDSREDASADTSRKSQAANGEATEEFGDEASPESREPRISFKLRPAKQTQALPPKPDLFAGKMAQMNAQSQQGPRPHPAFHENHRDAKISRYDDRRPEYPPRERHPRDRDDYRADYRSDYRDRPREPYPPSKYRDERPPMPKSAPPPQLPTLVQNGTRSKWSPSSPVIPVKVTAETPVWLVRQLMDGMLRNHRQRPNDIPEEWRSMYPPEESLADQYKQAKSQYPKKDDSVVGAGTYGQVYKTINVYKPEQGHVALKRVAMASESSGNGFPFTSVRELSTLVAIKDLRMPKYIESMVERVFGANPEKFDLWYYMVFEYVPFDLAGIINHPTLELDLGHRKDLAKQMYEGLVWLHDVGVLHRDIKAGNILVDHNGVLKLTDFGLAKRFDPKKGPHGRHTNRIVTIWYRCPELLLGDVEYGTEPDFWAAACVLGEILLETGAVLFPGSGTDVMQLDYMWSILGEPSVEDWPEMKSKPWYNLLLLDKDYARKVREAGGPDKRYQRKFEERYKDKFTPAALDLLQSALQWNPRRRPDGKTVLAHPFFTTEEPPPKRFSTLGAVLGADFHEFDYKKHRDAARAERNERHRQERELKKRESETATRQQQQQQQQGNISSKRSADDAVLVNGEAPRDVKKPKRESGADAGPADEVMVEACMEPGAPKEPTTEPATRPGSGCGPAENAIVVPMETEVVFRPSA